MLNSHRLSFPCAFHPSESISQFCQCQECMLPLCKQCSSIHQKEHATMSAPPNIIDIGHLVNKVNTDIQTQRQMLRKKSNMVEKLQKNAEETHKIALKRLEGDRNTTLKLINNKFDEMSKGLLAGYEQRLVYIKHIQDKIETLDKTLQIVNSTFYKGKPMRTIIMWQTQQLGNLGFQFQVKLQKQLLTPYKVQLIDIDSNKMNQTLNRLTVDRLLQSSSIIESEQSNDYLQVLSKVIETDIDARNQSAKRRSSKKQKNYSGQKQRVTGQSKPKKQVQILGSFDNNSHKGWANRTGKVFDIKEQFY